jgi:hypothetical protein
MRNWLFLSRSHSLEVIELSLNLRFTLMSRDFYCIIAQ